MSQAALLQAMSETAASPRPYSSHDDYLQLLDTVKILANAAQAARQV